MKQTNKIVKAYCPVSKQYYVMKVEPVSGVLRVTDFVDIDSDTGKKITSNVTVPGLTTAPNLLGCTEKHCQSRKVASCSHARQHFGRCSEGQGYRYQCVYCDKLHVFTADEPPEEYDERAVGSRSVIGNGMEIVISEIGQSAIEEIMVSTYWSNIRPIDIDSSVVLKMKRGMDLVYFGNKTHPSGCVFYRGDNLTGGSFEGKSDSERMMIYLRKVPLDCDALYFIMNVYSRGYFRDARNLSIKLIDNKTGRQLVRYDMQEINGSVPGLVVAKVYRKGGSWVFKAIGKAVNERDVHGLMEYCTD